MRTTYLYAGSLISGAFSGLIAAGITNNMDGELGLRAWRWLFIIEGVITVVIAFAAFFVLPNFPRTTSWLTEEEVALAVWRLEEDIGQDDWTASEDQSIFHGFVLAVKDIKTWVLVGFPHQSAPRRIPPEQRFVLTRRSSCWYSVTSRQLLSPTSSRLSSRPLGIAIFSHLS